MISAPTPVTTTSRHNPKASGGTRDRADRHRPTPGGRPRHLARRTRRPAPTGEGRHPRTGRHRRAAPPPADGRDAGLHADRRGRPRPAGRRLRRARAAHRLQPHVVGRRGVAVRRLHRLHVAVHPAGVPRQLRRPVRHRHQRSHRGGVGLQGQGRQQDGLVLVVGELVRRRRRRAARCGLRRQRLPARRRHGVPHLAHRRPRHRTTQPQLRADRPAAVGPPGGVAGLPRGLAEVADLLQLARLPRHRTRLRRERWLADDERDGGAVRRHPHHRRQPRRRSSPYSPTRLGTRTPNPATGSATRSTPTASPAPARCSP